jgi:PleD family two-component response regulator
LEQNHYRITVIISPRIIIRLGLHCTGVITEIARKMPVPARILMADDDHNVRIILAKCIRRLGYTVVEAANGEEALQMPADRHLDAGDVGS